MLLVYNRSFHVIFWGFFLRKKQKIILSGADPGFPVGGGANPPGEAPTYDFAKFCEKLHEIEKILGRRGTHARGVLP